MVLDCDADSMSQDIRIVCMDETPGGCSHLYNDGAVDTLVRLPQSVCMNFRSSYVGLTPGYLVWKRAICTTRARVGP